MRYFLSNQGGYYLQEEMGGVLETIFGYRLFLADPTTEIMVVWVDTSFGADGSQHTLRYGTDSSNLSQSQQATGLQIPQRDEYIYSVKLQGLSADTRYYLRVETPDGFKNLTPHDTFPTTVPAEGIRYLITSDLHIELDNVGIASPSELNSMASEGAKALLMVGDLVENHAWSFDNYNGGAWIHIMKNYMSVIDLPMLHLPGNHDVGNNTWDGTGSVNPDQNYYRIFFPNTAEIAPLGKNYGSSVFGDYLKVVGLDTHSEFPEDSRSFVENELADVNVRMIFPLHHSTIVYGERSNPDYDLQERLRNAWMKSFLTSPRVYASYCGHIHNRSLSNPLIYTVSDPQTSESFALLDSQGNPDGWAIVGANGHREFGQGWATGRVNDPHWALEYSESANQYFLLDITEDTAEVTEKDNSGTTLNTETFAFYSGEGASYSAATKRNIIEGASYSAATKRNIVAPVDYDSDPLEVDVPADNEGVAEFLIGASIEAIGESPVVSSEGTAVITIGASIEAIGQSPSTGEVRSRRFISHNGQKKEIFYRVKS